MMIYLLIGQKLQRLVKRAWGHWDLKFRIFYLKTSKTFENLYNSLKYNGNATTANTPITLIIILELHIPIRFCPDGKFICKAKEMLVKEKTK